LPTLDQILEWAAVGLPFILSILMALAPPNPNSRHLKLWKAVWIVAGLVVSMIVYWQQSRARVAHGQEVRELNQKLKTIESRISSLGEDGRRRGQEEANRQALREQLSRFHAQGNVIRQKTCCCGPTPACENRRRSWEHRVEQFLKQNGRVADADRFHGSIVHLGVTRVDIQSELGMLTQIIADLK
jgi:hypothetical protein